MKNKFVFLLIFISQSHLKANENCHEQPFKPIYTEPFNFNNTEYIIEQKVSQLACLEFEKLSKDQRIDFYNCPLYKLQEYVILAPHTTCIKQQSVDHVKYVCSSALDVRTNIRYGFEFTENNSCGNQTIVGVRTPTGESSVDEQAE